MGDFETPMTNGLFDNWAVFSCRHVQLGNLRGLFKLLRVSPGQVGKKWEPVLSFSYNPSDLFSWGVPGPSPFSQSTYLTPSTQSPARMVGTGSSMFRSLSLFHLYRGELRALASGLGQDFWKALREASGKAIGFGNQR